MDPTPLLDPTAHVEEGVPTGPGAAAMGVQLRVRGVSHSVAVRGARARKPILSGIDALFSPGSLTALMGASGAGKTTLLTLLRTGTPTAGEILANGRPYTKLARKLIVTVPQDDVLLPGLSAHEMLSYAAELRLPASVGSAGRAARVRAVLAQLHLGDECAHTRIGSVEERGLSGGQRKRVSIGLELLTDPPVLLLDEPTSGLDAKMARDVVAILRALSSEGRTVIATIHQPSARVFGAFDRLLLLSAGGVAYAGRVEGAEVYFSAQGFPTPEHENPADYYLQLLQDPEEAGGRDLLEAWAEWRGGRGAARAAASEGAAADVPEADEEAADARPPPHLAHAASSFGGELLPLDGSAQYAVSRAAQTWVLLRRRLYDAAKDRTKLGRSLALRLTLGVLVGVIWLGSGRDASYTSIFPTTGALFLVVNNSVMDTLFETVLQFPLQRALLHREYVNGTYALGAHYAALQLANLVFCSLSAALLGAPVYLLVGLDLSPPRVGAFVGLLVLMALIGACLGVIVGATTADIDSARGAIMPTLVPLLIFSGYLIPLRKIPAYFRWIYYGSFFQYGFGALQLNELAARNFTADCPAELAEEAAAALIHRALPDLPLPPLPNATCTGQDYLESVQLWPPPYGGLKGYFAILGAYLLLFLLLAYHVLASRVKQQARA